jgi:hypothetical protein
MGRAGRTVAARARDHYENRKSGVDHRGRSQAEDLAQQHPLSAVAMEDERPHLGDLS